MLETVCWSVTLREEHCGCFSQQYRMAEGYKDHMLQHYPESRLDIVPLVEKSRVIAKVDVEEYIKKLEENLARLRATSVCFRKERDGEEERFFSHQAHELALIVLDLQQIVRNNMYPNPAVGCSCHINPPCDSCVRGGSPLESER